MMIPIDKMSTTDKVIESIRSYIQEPGRNPGEKLPTENELGKQLGVGRSSIREALRLSLIHILFGKVIMEGACLIWGGNAFTIPDFMSGTYQIGNAVISKSNLFLIIAAIVIVALLQFYLQKTKPGKAMRCVAQNRTAASIVGIDVNRNMAITIAISTVICCCIGILVVPLYNVSSTMSNMIGLKGFAAGVLGGFGYMPGCIAGGLVLGIVENLSLIHI